MLIKLIKILPQAPRVVYCEMRIQCHFMHQQTNIRQQSQTILLNTHSCLYFALFLDKDELKSMI